MDKLDAHKGNDRLEGYVHALPPMGLSVATNGNRRALSHDPSCEQIRDLSERSLTLPLKLVQKTTKTGIEDLFVGH